MTAVIALRWTETEDYRTYQAGFSLHSTLNSAARFIKIVTAHEHEPNHLIQADGPPRSNEAYAWEIDLPENSDLFKIVSALDEFYNGIMLHPHELPEASHIVSQFPNLKPKTFDWQMTAISPT